MKTRTHPMDYNRRPRGADKIYHLPVCANCGNMTIPSFDEPNRAHCGTCGTVALCLVPETHIRELREAIALIDQPPASVQTELVYGVYDLDGRDFMDLKRTENETRY